MDAALQQIPVGLVVLLAPIVPFPWALALFLAILPFADPYVAGAGLAAILCCWLVRDLPRLRISMRALRTVGVVVCFAIVAVVQSVFVADDPGRLLSEILQWALTIALATAVILSVRTHEARIAAGGMIVGGVLLATAHLAIAASGFSFEGGSSLLQPETSNYAALYVLFGAVVLPLAFAGGRGSPWALASALLGLWAIYSNESRAALLVGILVLLLWAHRASSKRWMFWSIVSVAGLVTVTVMSRLTLQVAQFLQDPASVASVANFQTNFSNLERLGLIVHSFRLFAEHPLGMGIGASSEIYLSSPYTIGSYPTAHNTLAMLVAELGVLGLFGYLATLATMIVVFRSRDRRHGAPRLELLAVALMLSTVFDAVLFNGVVAITFWVLMGLVLGLAFGQPASPIFVLRKAGT